MGGRGIRRGGECVLFLVWWWKSCWDLAVRLAGAGARPTFFGRVCEEALGLSTSVEMTELGIGQIRSLGTRCRVRALLLPLRAAALLVLLTRSASARIIASDFRRAAHHLLHGFTLSGAGHAGLIKLTLLAALKSLFQVVN